MFYGIYYSMLALVLQMLAVQGLLVNRVDRGVAATYHTCEKLTNEETYSSLEVSIGNPPQKFHLVADTGSDNCIVKDCVCEHCLPEWGKECFKEPKTSKSFEVPVFASYNNTKEPASLSMNFGSGEISAEIASDQVSIGSIKTYMKNGLLLMYDHGLEIRSHFEGILGLGRPTDDTSYSQIGQPDGITIPGFLDSASVRRFSICFNHAADGVLGFNTRSHHREMSSVGKMHWGLAFHGLSIGDQEAKIGDCDPKNIKKGMESVCSIIPDTGTTLVVGPEAQIATLFEKLCNNWSRCKNTHRELHKEMSKMTKSGVKIEGPAGAMDLLESQADFDSFMEIVGEVMARSKPEDEQEEMIPLPREPDMMSGASTKINPLMDEDDGKFSIPPSMTLQLLLEHCASWIKDVNLNTEMPPLKFHVADTNGRTDTLEIPPSTYIFSKDVDVEVPSIKNVLGFPLKIRSPAHEMVCMMGFSAMDYSTERNGDTWIFGTPLFYEYRVFYDRGEEAEGKKRDNTLGFTSNKDEACGKCEGNEIVRPPSFLEEKVSTKVGLEALNHLSKPPIIRHMKPGREYI